VTYLVFSWYALSWAATLDYMARSASLECGSDAGRPSRQAIVISFPVIQARRRLSKVQPHTAEIVQFDVIRCRMKRHKTVTQIQ
jgi:hypothetical protein